MHSMKRREYGVTTATGRCFPVHCNRAVGKAGPGSLIDAAFHCLNNAIMIAPC